MATAHMEARSVEPQADRTGRTRVMIESVSPQVDGGRFAVKRTVGEPVVVEADAFTDGHDEIACLLLHRYEDQDDWTEVPMKALVNDRWRSEFPVEKLGNYYFTVQAWIDRFGSWRRDLRKRVAAEQDVAVDLLIGAELIQAAAERAEGRDREELQAWARRVRDAQGRSELERIYEDEDLAWLMHRHDERPFAASLDRELPVCVEPEKARFSAWYELFPRSTASEPGRHGTFKDVQARLPYVASLGFDVLYFAPIHPIGHTHRKGKNNATVPQPDDTGSPWAIGSEEGGHKSIHRELGTLEEFRELVQAAKNLGIDVSLDIAFQCSPDHPYVREHPEWFLNRPDGTIQYAENPPKKYQDIYPFYFECENWRELWEELKSVFDYWIDQGVKIFRVDNPHTKPFAFWEWCIGEIRKEHPDVIFLSEAFTRPKVMYRLAKLGFSQSYTYFAWRNTKYELTQYLTEVTQPPVSDFFRPNLWPNTPDILTEQLQLGGRSTFVSRFVLAATLGANYGIYGPAFELMEHEPREPGSEEYLDSEKYQIRNWDLNREDSLAELVGRVNQIRKENPALQANHSLEFQPVDNEELICYTKHSDDLKNIIVTIVSIDPHYRQSGFVELSLEKFGLDPQHPYQMHDLISGARYLWHGHRNYVELDPHVVPAHIFCIRRQARTERDFEYFL